MKDDRVRYYSDPVNDDFAGTNINTCQVGADFPFVRSSAAWKVIAFIVYCATLSARLRVLSLR